jgi:hypothetical protein
LNTLWRTNDVDDRRCCVGESRSKRTCDIAQEGSDVMWWRKQKRWGLNGTVELLPEHNGSSGCSSRTTRQLAGGGGGVGGGGDSKVGEWEASIRRRLRLRGRRQTEKVGRGGE